MPMGFTSREEVMEFVRKNHVDIVNLWFTDILGRLKSLGLTRDELETAIHEGAGFDYHGGPGAGQVQDQSKR